MLSTINSSINLFHPLINKWFLKTFHSPTEIQEKAWPEIAANKNVLITAPTGCGKTLTAFLWAIDCFITEEFEPEKLTVLYISPLKALNNDVQKNLIAPLKELNRFFNENNTTLREIRVMTRSGDTPEKERRIITKTPPEILITTPESLNIILASKNNRHILKDIRCVILDEIHSVAGDKRGTYLMTAIERLTLLCGEFQRIVLSATVKPLETIANFVGGLTIKNKSLPPVYEKRKISIVKSSFKKKYKVTVRYPDFSVEDFSDEPIWMNCAKEFRKIIKKNKSTLIFANSKRSVEKITRLINETENDQIAYSHHGALSKELRLSVEQHLKAGTLKCIVATNSLELGIDIGHLDMVILVQTPFKISSAIQRIGRAGHAVGEISIADIYPLFGKDFIYAAVMTRCIDNFNIEDTCPVENPLDVLAQVILAMTSVEKWDIDDLYVFIKSVYSFRNLSKKHFDLIIDMLSGKYADIRIRELSPRMYVDKLDNTAEAKEGTAFLLFMSGGTIPDRGYYNIRLKDSKVKIGELDEEFVWERRLGDAFPFGNNVWRIQQITSNDVVVTPENRPINILPFWKAEEQNRDFYYSEKIGYFLERMDALLGNETLKNILETDYHMDSVAARTIIDFLEYEKRSIDTDLPHRHHMVIEHYNDPQNKNDNKQVILHTFWGGMVNRPFMIALSAYWEAHFGYSLQYYTDNDCILLSLPHVFSENDLFSFIAHDNIENLIRKKLESTGHFGSRFRENAGRALLLPKPHFNKRIPLWLNRLRSKKLLNSIEKFKDFPILLETWRTCLQDDFDIGNLKTVLEEIHQGIIKVSSVITAKPSPFCSNAIWRQTNKNIYEDDTPLYGKPSELNNDLIREIVQSSHLRPEIPLHIIELLDGKLKRTAPGYVPDSYNELFAWVNERKLIPISEWNELMVSIQREIPETYDEIITLIKSKVIVMKINAKSLDVVVSLENIPYIMKVFSIDLADIIYYDISGRELQSTTIHASIASIRIRKEYDEETDYQCKFFLYFLSFYSVVTPDFIKYTFGMDDDTFMALVESLCENEVIMDKISEKTDTDQLCTTENLERLLRMTRSARRARIDPLPIEKLQFFLASFQGLTNRSESVEGLQALLEKLFFYPAPVNAWEEYIIPSRMKTYHTSWLDSLTAEFSILWLGSGKKKIAPIFPDDLLFIYGKNSMSDTKIIEKLFRDTKGKYNFFNMLSFSGYTAAELSSILWKLAWNGRIINDSFETYRKGFLNNYSVKKNNSGEKSNRRTFNRWKATKPDIGNWCMVHYQNYEEIDPIEKEELKKEKVRFLLKRYGILFRSILENEHPAFSWKEILQPLRQMELSGEILSGYFFENIPGLQFISFDALELVQKQMSEEAIYWCNATDPVSLCGIKIDEIKRTLPPRNATTIIVFHGSKKVIVSRATFKKIDIFVPPDVPSLLNYFSFFKEHLSRQFNPIKRISIEAINGENPLKSAYLSAFKEFGFTANYKSLELWRSYDNKF